MASRRARRRVTAKCCGPYSGSGRNLLNIGRRKQLSGCAVAVRGRLVIQAILLRLLDHAEVDSQPSELNVVGHAQLFIKPVTICADGFRAQTERLGDFL